MPKKREANGGGVATQLLGFFVGRSLVSAAFALANQSIPDLTPALGPEATAWVATMDAGNAVVGFVTRPLWGGAIDAFGRKPALVVGCLGSAFARSLYASDPTSAARYVVYRVFNFMSNIPVMQASTALLADACGGRGSKLFQTVNRRMWMWLAVVRIVVVWAAGRTAASPSPPKASPTTTTNATEDDATAKRMQHRREAMRQLALAGVMSTAACVAFAVFSSETLAAKRPFGSPVAVWRESVAYFARSPERRALVPVLLLRALPLYSFSAMTTLCRDTFSWGPVERARLTMVENASEVLMPLLMSEATDLSPKSFQLDLRVATLTALNTGLTPNSNTVLANPVLGRVVDGSAEFNRALAAAQASFKGEFEGEGMLEAALATLEFPLGLLLPGFFLRLSRAAGSNRAPFWFVAVGLAACSEWAWPRALRVLASSSSR